MENTWRNHPHCRKRRWEEPKYPSSFERAEEFEGAEVFRAAFLAYLDSTEKPRVLDFLDTRPRPPRREFIRVRQPTAEEITGMSDVERLQKPIDERKRK